MKSLTICTLVVCLGLLHAGNVLGQSADQDAVAATFSRPTPPSQPVKLELVGYANKDIVPGTEQVAFDDKVKVAYLIGNTELYVLDVSSDAMDVYASSPKVLPVLLTKDLPTPVTDVYFCGDLLAVSAEGATKVQPGQVLIFTRYQRSGTPGVNPVDSLKLLANFTVGALPDQLEFSKDCKTLLVSNEGEPDGYGDPKYTDPEGSVSVINLDLVYTTGGSFNRRCKPKSNSRTSSARPCLVTGVTGTVRTAGFTAWNGKKEELLKQGISISGPGSTVAQDLEPEYTTFSADEKLAFVSLQENSAIAVLDVATATITALFPMGLKDHSLPQNPLDPSDRDGGINIKNWPVFGMRMPDEIRSFNHKGVDFVATANEGDERDWPGFKEGARLKDIINLLDPAVFPNASQTIGQDSQLGRLTVYAVVNALTDTDNNGKMDRILAYGGRSFSIYKADEAQGSKGAHNKGAPMVKNLTQIYDSGAQLENLVAELLPAIFNSEGTNDTFDSRSDNKGPEPEGMDIAEIPVTGGKKGQVRRIMFLGTERTSIIFVYDITDPYKPVFQSIAMNPKPDPLNSKTWLTLPEGISFEWYTVNGGMGSKAAADPAHFTTSKQVPIVMVAYEGQDNGGIGVYRVVA